MPRGQPDYSNPSYGQGGSYLDPGLLTLASAGFTSIDGKGRPIILDTFGEGMGAWSVVLTDTGYAYGVISSYGYIPPACMHFAPGQVSEFSQVLIYRYAKWPATSRVGLEFCHQSVRARTYFEAGLKAYIGDTYHNAIVRINSFTQALSIETPSGHVEISAQITEQNYGVWVPIKLVTDPEQNKYVRLQIGPTLYDLSAYDLLSGASVVRDMISVDFSSTWNTVAGGTNEYLGYCLVTSDEP